MSDPIQLQYVGPPSAANANDSELATVNFIDALMAHNLPMGDPTTPNTVQYMVNQTLSKYVTKQYVDEQAQTLASTDEIFQNAVNTLFLSQIGNTTATLPSSPIINGETPLSWAQDIENANAIATASAGAYPPYLVSWAQTFLADQALNPPQSPTPVLPGVVPLTTAANNGILTPTGSNTLMVPNAFLGSGNTNVVPNNQVYPKAIASPSIYNGAVTSGSYGVMAGPAYTLTSGLIPNVAYYPLIFGSVDVTISFPEPLSSYTYDGNVMPIVVVSAGAMPPNGVLLAAGAGTAESYTGGQMYQASGYGTNGQYQIPTWAGYVVIAAVGGGSGGESGWGGLTAGSGGDPGKWDYYLLPASQFPPSNVLTWTRGTGGAGGISGVPASLSSWGIPSRAKTFGLDGTASNVYSGTVELVPGATGGLAFVTFDAVRPITGVSSGDGDSITKLGASSPYNFNLPGTANQTAVGSPGTGQGCGGSGGAPSRAYNEVIGADGGAGSDGDIWFMAIPNNVATPSNVKAGTATSPCTILPAALGTYPPLTGNQTLYITLWFGTNPNFKFGDGAPTATLCAGSLSNLCILPIPAGGG